MWCAASTRTRTAVLWSGWQAPTTARLTDNWIQMIIRLNDEMSCNQSNEISGVHNIELRPAVCPINYPNTTSRSVAELFRLQFSLIVLRRAIKTFPVSHIVSFFLIFCIIKFITSKWEGKYNNEQNRWTSHETPNTPESLTTDNAWMSEMWMDSNEPPKPFSSHSNFFSPFSKRHEHPTNDDDNKKQIYCVIYTLKMMKKKVCGSGHSFISRSCQIIKKCHFINLDIKISAGR